MPRLASVGPRVGCHAPEVGVVGIARTTHGEPRVIAFVRDGFEDADPDALARIRAELRGLGAELIALSPRGVWWLGPDDAVARVDDAAVAGVAAAAQRFEVDGDAVFVVDGRGVVRFAHRPARPLAPSCSALA